MVTFAARLIALLVFVTGPALANCLPVASAPPRIIPASFNMAQAREPSVDAMVRLTFLGHASFLIETPGGARAVTDYNGVWRPPTLPDLVTMNNAHSTHYTTWTPPEIQHVLRGWDEGGGMAKHNVQFKDLHVRNVPTNVRDVGGTRVAGNSIFVFEVAGLCIAHLGHLHHDLTDLHLGELGLIDILLVPADGSFTASHETMWRVVEQINPAVIIPMHWFTEQRRAEFVAKLTSTYAVSVRDNATVAFSRATLPRRTIILLPGEH